MQLRPTYLERELSPDQLPVYIVILDPDRAHCYRFNVTTHVLFQGLDESYSAHGITRTQIVWEGAMLKFFMQHLPKKHVSMHIKR